LVTITILYVWPSARTVQISCGLGTSVSPLDDRVDLSGEDRPALDQHIGKLM
jgi:hypothetical protein